MQANRRGSQKPEQTTSKVRVLAGNSAGPGQHLERSKAMRCYWEQIGVLGPTYRLLGQGLSDDQIAGTLKLPGH